HGRVSKQGGNDLLANHSEQPAGEVSDEDEGPGRNEPSPDVHDGPIRAESGAGGVVGPGTVVSMNLGAYRSIL
ncbi:MAG TPA: hypothetical protein VKT80_03015, partial [Chloroflexota bacterium]|nr:hypothetical protein [Chloroflexota bacterium]